MRAAIKQRGIALAEVMIALVVGVVIISGIALLVGKVKTRQSRVDVVATQAREMAMLATAAKTYARDFSDTIPEEGVTHEIPIADLIAAQLLPANFSERVATRVGMTPFHQTYRVVARRDAEGNIPVLVYESGAASTAQLKRAGAHRDVETVKAEIARRVMREYKYSTALVQSGQAVASNQSFSVDVSSWLSISPAPPTNEPVAAVLIGFGFDPDLTTPTLATRGQWDRCNLHWPTLGSGGQWEAPQCPAGAQELHSIQMCDFSDLQYPTDVGPMFSRRRIEMLEPKSIFRRYDTDEWSPCHWERAYEDYDQWRLIQVIQLNSVEIGSYDGVLGNAGACDHQYWGQQTSGAGPPSYHCRENRTRPPADYDGERGWAAKVAVPTPAPIIQLGNEARAVLCCHPLNN